MGKQTVIVGEDIVPTHKHSVPMRVFNNLGSFLSLEQRGNRLNMFCRTLLGSAWGKNVSFLTNFSCRENIVWRRPTFSEIVFSSNSNPQEAFYFLSVLEKVLKSQLLNLYSYRKKSTFPLSNLFMQWSK